MSELSRRSLLLLAGGAAVGGFAPVASAAALPVAGIPQRARLLPLVGTRVTASGTSGRCPIRLLRLEDVAHAGKPNASFSLVFETVSGQPLAEGQYHLNGPGWPRLVLLLNPLGQAGSSSRLQAIVNRG